MRITLEYLKKNHACANSIIEFKKLNKSNMTIKKIFELLLKNPYIITVNNEEENKLSWANWLICRILNRKQKVQYAVFAAKKVIDIFEKKYPNNDRPRKAIEAAQKWIKNSTEKNKKAAYAAYAAAAVAYATATDADAVYAAAAAAVYAAAVAYATDAAADADAVYAAYAAAVYAAYAAYAAAAAADAVDTDAKIKIKIIKYGLKLLKIKL
jgi:hypothetical protein